MTPALWVVGGCAWLTLVTRPVFDGLSVLCAATVLACAAWWWTGRRPVLPDSPCQTVGCRRPAARWLTTQGRVRWWCEECADDHAIRDVRADR